VDDWDQDSPRLRQNLTRLLGNIRDSALHREVPTLAMARQWQTAAMAGLRVPKPEYIGRFRGEPGVRATRAWIGDAEAVLPAAVGAQLALFEARLQRTRAALDARYPVDQALDPDGLAAVIDISAWAHSEWIRIHPFANGNGRTARLWANALLMRYGLPPVVRLRPPPDGRYGEAGACSMGGDWKPTASMLRSLLRDLLSPAPPSRPIRTARKPRAP
jgi:Fic/DOC family